MGDSIFASVAPLCWSNGYSVFPCRPGGKEPAIKSQHSYIDNIPSAERQREWLSQFPDANVGLLLGKKLPDGTVLAALDTDVPEYSRLIGSLAGNCPAIKKSPRGLTYFIRMAEGTKSFKLKNHEGKAVCDVLVTKAYSILPPSIHPSGSPYEWATEKAIWQCKFEELPYVE